MPAPKLRSTAVALLLLGPLAASFVATTTPAIAAPAQPAIGTMSINSDAGLAPGARLRVQVSATPDARSATLSLGEGGVTVPLHQDAPGKYTGSYVVREGDRIDPMQRMTARLAFGEHTYTRQFNFPPGFQALAMGSAPPQQARSMGNAPPQQSLAIEHFVMRSVRGLEPGSELHFRLTGAPGASAWVHIPGVVQRVDLVETRPGLYEGSYTVRRRDDPDGFRVAVATLEHEGQHANARIAFESRGRVVQERREEADARPAAAGPLPLQVTSYQDNAVIDADGDLSVRGHTAPFANVRVLVDAVAMGARQTVADQSVQADRNGRFSVVVDPRVQPAPGLRFELRVLATNGSQSAEERLTLLQRRG
ncbi:hypothetical protein JJB11_17940 [Ramlibacter ginsenosidimutans]|uniref:DUF4198 domain-containing protein n=1 Tax=Ramlibacter ginsenosidimutans TaxID=502333 RepID=A0A934WNW5_9BURK|nr:hypothetical protein [Ramlibacter ginsenosidimutans]MBK6007985.1 hypothetical protein [Ramlibacter ginsenosidimutans]